MFIFINPNLSGSMLFIVQFLHFKDALSGLRQFLGSASRLITMKKTFYFTAKALFVFNIFKFLP